MPNEDINRSRVVIPPQTVLTSAQTIAAPAQIVLTSAQAVVRNGEAVASNGKAIVKLIFPVAICGTDVVIACAFAIQQRRPFWY